MVGETRLFSRARYWLFILFSGMGSVCEMDSEVCISRQGVKKRVILVERRD